VKARIAQLWRSDRTFLIWIAVFVAIVLVSFAGPVFLPDASDQSPADRLQGPSLGHLFGTDGYGRDIFARAVSAGRVSLALALLIALTASVLGSTIGLVSGYWGKSASVLMRAMDALMAFPGIVLSIALVTAIGPGWFSEFVALSVVFTPLIARVVRSRTLTLAVRQYIVAARSAGVSGIRILLTHVLPNALPTILVQTVLIFAAALLLDGTLSFLGMGVQPPTPTWGNMIAEARPFLTIVPVFVVVPGLAIILAVLTLNSIGTGIRNLVDPRAKALASLDGIRRRQDRLRRTEGKATV
jgi:peptide/nickel transport system permease protein